MIAWPAIDGPKSVALTELTPYLLAFCASKSYAELRWLVESDRSFALTSKPTVMLRNRPSGLICAHIHCWNLSMLRKLLARLRSMKVFAPIALAALFGTSVARGGE
jgi:hypothetical protein